jgi:ATP-dependent Clp protease protease subunit
MAKRISKDDTDRFHDYSLYIPHRTLYLGSEEYNIEQGESGIDGAIAERTIKNLHILDSMSQDPITILLNNIGGDVNHGLAIYDAIITSKSHITIKVFGNSMSMGSIILQAADERIMSPNAVQMVHYGSLGVEGHAKTVYKIADEGKRIDQWMETMYLERIRQKHPTFSLKKLKDILNHDTFLTAHDSVNLGLADKILGSEE